MNIVDIYCSFIKDVKYLKHNHFNFNTSNFLYLQKKFFLQKKLYICVIVEITIFLYSLLICIFFIKLMVGSYTEPFPNDIVTNLLFPKTMHIITLMEVDEDQCWYLLNKNKEKRMPSKVVGHTTSIDIQ